MKIGIPQSLLYYDYYPFWETFFEGLGYEIVLSGDTTKAILDMGALACVQDSCIPVKLYHGHVLNLLDRCDKVFVPRFVSIARREFICPKFIGLPEMLRGAGVIDDDKMLVIDIDGYKKPHERHRDFARYAMEVCGDRKKVESIMTNCELEQQKYEKERLHSFNRQRRRDTKGVIGLIGHPYIIYDTHINMNIGEKLRNNGYSIIYPENIAIGNIDTECARLPKRIFLSYCRRLFGSGMDMMRNNRVDGLIFITSFACGVDALMGELLEIYNNRYFNIPYTTIVIDEHTGEGGVKTRVEAFLDMVGWRRRDGIDVSAHGKDVHFSKGIF